MTWVPNSKPIASFGPQWLDDGEPHRYQMGVSILCPRHGEPCRLEAWFANPCDGDLPGFGKRPFYWRTGSMLVELTLEPMLVFPGHWSGWITEGRLYSAKGSLALVSESEE